MIVAIPLLALIGVVLTAYLWAWLDGGGRRFMWRKVMSGSETGKAMTPLACPFCGRPPHVVEDDSYGGCHVGCNCEAEPAVLQVFGKMDEAIAVWNRRPPPAATNENER